MHQIKRFKTLSAGTAGDVETSKEAQEIFLHRQGTSNTFYGGLGNGILRVSIELRDLGEGVSICCDSYSEEDRNHCMESRTFASGTLPTWLIAHRTLNPVLEAEIYISKKLGVNAKISATRLAYMYDGQVRDDVIFSPFVYEASTDTIRSAVENYCIVYFTEGKFEKPNFDMDRAAGIYQPFIAEALRKGFHECDRKRGQDYCKRRLAWLAGEYAKQDLLKQHGELKVGILTSLMEWPRQSSETRLAA